MEVITEIDAQAIDRLFHEHYEGLSRYAFSILKEQGAAEDVVQQLFITLWEKRDDLEISKDPRDICTVQRTIVVSTKLNA